MLLMEIKRSPLTSVRKRRRRGPLWFSTWPWKCWV